MSNEEYVPSQPRPPQQQRQPSSEEPSLRAFTPELDSVAHDPIDPTKRYHTGIFVETNPSLSTGTMHQVTGDVISQNGTRYEEKADYLPGSEAPLHRLIPIGVI